MHSPRPGRAPSAQAVCPAPRPSAERPAARAAAARLRLRPAAARSHARAYPASACHVRHACPARLSTLALRTPARSPAPQRPCVRLLPSPAPCRDTAACLATHAALSFATVPHNTIFCIATNLSSAMSLSLQYINCIAIQFQAKTPILQYNFHNPLSYYLQYNFNIATQIYLFFFNIIGQ